MDYSLLMCRFKSLSDLQGKFQGFLHGKGPLQFVSGEHAEEVNVTQITISRHCQAYTEKGKVGHSRYTRPVGHHDSLSRTESLQFAEQN